jgi:hypothetical protein
MDLVQSQGNRKRGRCHHMKRFGGTPAFKMKGSANGLLLSTRRDWKSVQNVPHETARKSERGARVTETTSSGG